MFCHDCRWYTLLTCHFTHVNIFHAACNIYCLFVILSISRTNVIKWISAYIFAILSLLISQPEMLVSGFSAVIYAYIGMVIKLKYETISKTIAMTIAYYVVSLLTGANLSIVIHLLSFVMGLGVNFFMEFSNKIINRYVDKRD